MQPLTSELLVSRSGGDTCFASAGGYKPSRFNAYTTAPDGTLILANTFSGAICAIPKVGTAHVRRYLSGKVAGELDDLGAFVNLIWPTLML